MLYTRGLNIIMEGQPNMPGMNPNQQSPNPALDGERTASTEAQLLQNMLTEGVDKEEEQIDDYLATSFLDRDELAVIRDYDELILRIKRVGRLLGLKNPQDQETKEARKVLTRMVKDKVNRMQMIAQTSKSKGGAGFKAVRTEKIVQEENLFQEQKMGEDSQGLFERLMGATEGQAVVNATDPAINTNTDPGKW